MDAYEKSLPIEREPSSSRAFGDWSLELLSGTDAVPREIFFADPQPTSSERALLREAYRRLLRDAGPRVLDLAAGEESYLDPDPRRLLVGLSHDGAAMTANPLLDDRVVHDLNADPRLPFPDGSFDAVLLTLQAGALRLPLEVFRDVHRVLAPGGTAVTTFLHPYVDRRFSRMWALGDDRDHVFLAEAFFSFSGRRFARPTTVCLLEGPGGMEVLHAGQPPEDRGRPRVWTVWSTKGPPPPSRVEHPPFPERSSPEPLEAEVSLDPSGRPKCIWCGAPMSRYAPPVTVFEIDYGVAELYVCFSDRCAYYRRSKAWMRSQGHPGYSYRFQWNPATGASGPIPDNLADGLASGRLD